jgi:hypothetical protein
MMAWRCALVPAKKSPEFLPCSPRSHPVKLLLSFAAPALAVLETGHGRRGVSRKDESMSIDWTLAVPIVQVIGTVGGLLLVWWKVTQIREVNAYELLRDEVKRFNSPEMRASRARLARALQTSPRDFEKIDQEADEVCGYFENIGGLLRRNIIPRYFVWSMQGDDIFHYWQPLRDYVNWVREVTKDKTIYEDFDYLRHRIAELQKKRSGLEPIYPETEIREYLKGEAEQASGSTTKRPRRKSAQ